MKTLLIALNVPFRIWMLSVVVVLMGCSTIDVSSDYDRNVSFENFNTYAWAPGAQPRVQDPRIDNTLLDSRVHSAVDRALSRKGFQKQSEGKANFWVGYQAAINKKLDVTTIDFPYHTPSTRDIASGSFRGYSSWGHMGYGGSQTFVSQYDEGALIVDVVDPETKNLIWRGTAKAAIDEKATPEKREARINAAVEKIFSQFPPRKS